MDSLIYDIAAEKRSGFSEVNPMLSRTLMSGVAGQWILAFCVAAAASTSQRAYAQTETRSELVHTRDLDLTTIAGRDALDRRIRAAARRVCPRSNPSLSPYTAFGINAASWRCTKKAIAGTSDARARAVDRAFALQETGAAPGIGDLRTGIRSHAGITPTITPIAQ